MPPRCEVLDWGTIDEAGVGCHAFEKLRGYCNHTYEQCDGAIGNLKI